MSKIARLATIKPPPVAGITDYKLVVGQEGIESMEETASGVLCRRKNGKHFAVPFSNIIVFEYADEKQTKGTKSKK